MYLQAVSLSNIDLVSPLFDAYRVFYEQESNVEACRSFVKGLVEEKRNNMWMAMHESEGAVGFINLYPSYTSVGMAPVYILNDLYVLPNYRNSGVGSLLLNHAKEWAKKKGAVRLHLETGIENTTAQKLYEGIGWKKEKDTIFYYLPIA